MIPPQSNRDYMTLLARQIPPRRRSVPERAWGWLRENIIAVIALIVVAVLFWLATGPVWIQWLTSGCPC